MPYIAKCLRSEYDPEIEKLLDSMRYLNNSPGDLNYIVTRLTDGWVKNKGKKYENLNAAIGALECAKQELYRRIIGPYEDTKIKENGDAYGN